MATLSISTSSVTATTVLVTWSISNSGESLPRYSITGPGGVSSTSASGSATATGLSPGTSYTWTYTYTYYNPSIGEDVTQTKTASATTLAIPVWTDSSIGTNAQVNVSFNNGISATNATSYSVFSGALPTGLSLNTSTGAVTGTPNTTGTYTGTFRATNANGYVSANFSVVVWSAVSWTDNTIVTSGQKSVAYSDDISASGSPTPTYSVSSGSLPPGLSLNSSNGNLTGTPTTSGTYNFTLRAAHSYSNVTSAKTFVVWEPVSWTDNTILLEATEGSSYSDAVSASGSPAPTYSVTSGALPSGLSINSTTGAITGTIATGTAASSPYSITITAQNAYSSTTVDFVLVIDEVPPPEIIRGFQLYNGSSFAPSNKKYWDGSAWVERTVRVFNGSTWERVL